MSIEKQRGRAQASLQRFVDRHPELSGLLDACEAAVIAIAEAMDQGGTLLSCGNGGSAADACHLVAELQKSFELPRPLLPRLAEKLDADVATRLQCGLRAVSLSADVAIMTAVANDQGSDLVFAQQVVALGRPGDVLLAISTSGNSRNVLVAVEVAKAVGMSCIALTGGSGGLLAEACDVAIVAPSTRTASIQEQHLPIYHALCLALEEYYYG